MILPKKDLLLLSYLRNNARESLTKLSKKTGIPISTIFDRLKAYEKDFICNHVTLIDFSRLGYGAKVQIMIKVEKERRAEIKMHLMKNQFVNSAYKINNGYDFLIEGIFKDIGALQEFIENLEERFNINEKQVFFVIEDIKKEKFLADTQLLKVGAE
jgi:DNA-binding Lrp family transcriptional regulator